MLFFFSSPGQRPCDFGILILYISHCLTNKLKWIIKIYSKSFHVVFFSSPGQRPCDFGIMMVSTVISFSHFHLGTAWHLSSPLVFSWVHAAQSLDFCVVFCRWLFVLFLLASVLPILLRFTYSEYPYGVLTLLGPV